MKKLFSVLLSVISGLALSTAAFADIAPLPSERAGEVLSSWVAPVVLAVVIIAAVILVKALRGRKK